MISKNNSIKRVLFVILLAIAFHVNGQNPNPEIKSVIVSDATCNGKSDGRIVITVSNGSPPFQYSIDNGESFQSSNTFMGLAVGKYLLKVKDRVGRISENIVSKIIKEPAKLEIKCSVNNITCNGFKNGSVHAIVKGGKLPYSFSWSGSTSTESSIGGLSAGTYMVTVFDSVRCSVSDTFKIVEPGKLVATAKGTNLTCGNNTSGTVSVSATGGTGQYFYRWNKGTNPTSQSQTGLSAGTYIVTVNDSNQCMDTSSVTITQQGSVTEKYAIGDTTSCGIVFYVDPDFESDNPCSSRYLICAFEDQNPAIPWYKGTYIVTNSNIDRLFDKSNADQIIKAQGDSVLYAATVCAKYNTNNRICNGWYLPSEEELKLIYTNLIEKRSSPLGGFSNEGYWSSVEKNLRKAWIVDFLDGRKFVSNKANNYHVRAVREYITH